MTIDTWDDETTDGGLPEESVSTPAAPVTTEEPAAPAAPAAPVIDLDHLDRIDDILTSL